MELLGKETNFDFIGRARFFFTASAIAVLASIVLIATVGLNFGIDFAGGYEIQVKFPEKVSDVQINDLVKPIGLGDARIQRFGAEEDNEYLILVREHGTITEEAKAKLYDTFVALAGGEEEIINWSVAQSGENLMVGFKTAVTEDKVRALVEQSGLVVKAITRGEREDRPEYSVDLVSIADNIEKALRDGLGISQEAEIVQRVEFVGPQVGAQLRNQGIMAVVYALVFILLYIAIRFDLFFSPGAVIALIHDVLITMGVFALLQFEFNLPIIGAILALVGYSLNDTIIVYDRIRENALRLRGRELRSMVNTSINQTLSRTLLTSFTTLLVVLALFIFGGGIIRDFSVALLVGIVVGTYSSIFVASPIYIFLREKSGKGGAQLKADKVAA
ncbi:MAG: protein-export membrane protein SecF [Deltaproteobacteria bacterium RIFOXYA12_FULL_58_15]|nr:MAG: protein-export membrane protein SecF [Deltaproteobacteria bacterium RIFOXYA12_FULL_58_15]OGR11576.1 MAG: protein-export membrane protein SecF [Deltaproteobacteria bacterium RIFOXYB12_FULL_58_9]